MSKIEPEAWNRLTAVRGEERSGDRLKEGDGISQRTSMQDPWTWTMMWGLTVGVGGGLDEGAKGENMEPLYQHK